MEQPQLIEGPVGQVWLMAQRSDDRHWQVELAWRGTFAEDGSSWHRAAYDRLDGGELLDVVGAELFGLLALYEVGSAPELYCTRRR